MNYREYPSIHISHTYFTEPLLLLYCSVIDVVLHTNDLFYYYMQLGVTLPRILSMMYSATYTDVQFQCIAYLRRQPIQSHENTHSVAMNMQET